MADMGGDIKKLGGDINKVSHGMQSIGLGIDTQTLAIVSGAFQIIGGSASVIKGLRAQKEAYNAWRQAEGQAQLLKWGPGAPAVAQMAQAGAQTMGFMIGEVLRTVNSDGSGQSMRAIQGGTVNGR